MADEDVEIIRSTGYWSTAVRYKELDGSGGQEMANDDNNRATRKFWVRWEDQIAFSRELLGGTSQVGAALQVRTQPKRDPDRTFLTCQSVKTTGIKNIGEDDGVIKYAIAEIEATFASPKTPDGNGDENQESVTYLTESWDVQKNLYPRKGWFFYWKEGSQVDKAVGEDATLTDEQLELKISIDVHKWYNPPLLEMLTAIGKVNDRPHRLTFVTFPTGTLKFNNVKPSYELTDEGMSPFKVSLEYAFVPNGWNKVYCPQDAEFREIGSAFDDPPFLPYNFDLPHTGGDRLMVDIPRSIAAVPGDPFPNEWNKVVACLRLLDQLGVFRRGAPSAARVVAEVKLQADLYRGVTDDKVVGRLVSWDGTDLVESDPVVELDIHANRFGGFAFNGEIVRAELCGKNGRWYAIGAGHYHVRITLSATLNVGSSAAGVATDLTGTPAMTVYDYAMAIGQSIASSKTFGAHWDSGLKKWTLPGPKCADVSG